MAIRWPFAIQTIAICLTFLCFVPALAQSSVPASPEIAKQFIRVSGSAADAAFYSQLLAPVIVQAYKTQHPDVSARCVSAMTAALRELMTSYKEQFEDAEAQVYAARFSNEELQELGGFLGSDLGQRYRYASRTDVARGTEKSSAALPFVKGVSEAVAGHGPSAEARTNLVLRSLSKQLSEDDVTQLRTFFYNGVGKKYRDTVPDIEKEVAARMVPLMLEAAKRLRDRVIQGGNCQ